MARDAGVTDAIKDTTTCWQFPSAHVNLIYIKTALAHVAISMCSRAITQMRYGAKHVDVLQQIYCLSCLISAAPPDKHTATTQTARPAKRDVTVQTVRADIMKLPRVTQDHKRRTRSRYRPTPRKEPEQCRHCFDLWGAPFENFGWADEVDTIGAKQTFNVAASTNEVYPSALAAARTRQRSPTPPPPMQRKTFRSGRPHSAPPKDRRLWISEYREQYR